MTKKQLANRFSNKNPLRIVFAGELNLSMGSDRIFSYNFCNNLSKIDNVYAVLRNEYSESDVDVLILKKSFALEKLIEIRKSNKDLLIGIINPSDKKRGILENVDFAIVGSVEERAYYSCCISKIVWAPTFHTNPFVSTDTIISFFWYSSPIRSSRR